MVTGLAGCIASGLLRGKRRPFARTAEAQRTRALPRQRFAFTVRDGHNGVVEGRLYEHHAVRDVLAFLLLEDFFLAFCSGSAGARRCCCFCHYFFPLHRYWKSYPAIPSAMSLSCELLAPGF